MSQWTHELRKSFGLISRHRSLAAALKAKAHNEAETRHYNAVSNPKKQVDGLRSVFLNEPTIIVTLPTH